MPDEKQLKGGGVILTDSLRKDQVHYEEAGIASGASGGWSHDNYRQEAESEQEARLG